MREIRTRSAVAAAILATAVAAAMIATPVVAKAKYDAKNAHRVDGLHAKQLSKARYFTDNKTFDGFNSCTPTTALSGKFKAPADGFLIVNSSLGAARDTDTPEDAILSTRILIDGVVVSRESGGTLHTDGSFGDNISNLGGAKVKKGKHTITLQMRACGGATGAAFVLNESMTAQFSVSGVADSLSTKIAGRASND